MIVVVTQQPRGKEVGLPLLRSVWQCHILPIKSIKPSLRISQIHRNCYFISLGLWRINERINYIVIWRNY